MDKKHCEKGAVTVEYFTQVQATYNYIAKSALQFAT